MMRRIQALCAPALLLALATAAPAQELRTVAEQSGFAVTGRYEEVERLCPAYEAAWKGVVRCFEFGRTPEGRPMLALVVTRTGALAPQAAKKRALPVVLMQGGIHAGEIDGKDAGFLAVREMLEDTAAPGALDKVVLVFVPVFNIDGHERMSPWNRPNQSGPEEMGWRVTSQNLNLNRDYAKADSPEMQAMLALLNAWDPILYMDLHATDGAKFQHDIANLLEPRYTGDPAMQKLGRRILKDANDRIAKSGAMPLDFYPSLKDSNDPAAGFLDEVAPPRFSTGYWSLRNRFALLVETHSWKPYPVRVRLTRDTIIAFMEMAARDGQAWLKAAEKADRDGAALGGKPVPVRYITTDKARMIDFEGYAFRHELSEVSGALALRYDTSRPETWRVPLYVDAEPDVEVTAPRGGYIVPPAHAAWVAGKLLLHDIAFRALAGDAGVRKVETFRVEAPVFASASFEGHMMLTLNGEWEPEEQAVPAGSLFVPIAQPKARLVMALFEPQAPDSFAAWGFFNAHFEAKEYMEAYVLEELASEMLAADPALAAEFKALLRSDPDFAADPARRLNFFYARHPAWDERLNLYPVYRTPEPIKGSE